MDPHYAMNEDELSTDTDTGDSDSSASEKSDDKEIDELFNSKNALFQQSIVEINEDELNDSVHRLLSLFTISSSVKAEINVHDQVKKYLTDGTVRNLFLYVENNSLRAEFTCPDYRTATMYYIKRNSSGETMLANSWDRYIFGNVDENFEKALILIFKMIYTMIFYSLNDLPYRVRIQLTKSLEEFLCCITEKYYRQIGRTVIYNPAMTMMSKENLTSRIKFDDLLRLFERVVVSWCNQLSDIIFDDELDYERITDFSPITVIEFWEYKMDNLLHIQKSLQNEQTLFVCKTLEEHHSAYIHLLYDLTNKLEDKVQEANSNVSFLQKLKSASENLNEATLNSMSKEIPVLMMHIGEIITESPYLKLEKNSTVLVDSMSQQIINVCKRYVKVQDILHGQTGDSVKAINQSMIVCSMYEKTLREQSKEHDSFTDQLLQNVSDRVNEFNQRCTDLLEICSLVNIFYDGKNFENRPKCSLEMKEKLSLLSEEFFNSLHEMQLTQANIFSYKNEFWCAKNYRFRERMEKIEVSIAELIENAFTYVKTIADGIDILLLMYPYSKWLGIKIVIEEKYILIIEKFLEEVNAIKDYLLVAKVKLGLKSVHRMTEIMSIFTKKQGLQRLHEILNSCDWLKSFSISKTREYQEEYEEINGEMNQIIKDQYEEWNEKLSPSFLTRLKRPLIAKRFYTPSLLEPNIDRKLLRVLEEGSTWVRIGCTPTPMIDKLVKASPQILNLFRNVEDLIMIYNKIITRLSSDERSLFLPFIKRCNEIIKPALHTLYWDSESSNEFILEHLKQIQYVENLVRNYKTQNELFRDICKEICHLNLIHITKNSLSEIIQEFQSLRLLYFKKLATCYNKIVSCVQSVFDSFGHRILKVKMVWNAYIRKMDQFFSQALKSCLKNTLENVLCSISADSHTGLIPTTIQLSIFIKEREMVFQPELLDIKTFFYTFKINLFEIVKLIPRLFNKFKMTKGNKESSYAQELFEDCNINKIQERINAEIEKNLQKVIIHTRKWDKYESLWKTDVNNHVEQHIVKFSDIDPFHTGFISYRAMVNEMQFKITTEETVCMFRINMREIVSEIIQQCEKRSLRLSVVLQQMVFDRIRNISTHIEREYITLDSFEYKTNTDLVILKSIFNELAVIEKEMIKISDYKFLLEKSKFFVKPELTKITVDLQKKYAEYTNVVLRCRLKMEKVHGISL